MEHTPGPWKAEFYECGEDPEDNGWLICHPGTECPDTVVCRVDGEGLDNLADAALIARAPELLEENEALKKRINELEFEEEMRNIRVSVKDIEIKYLLKEKQRLMDCLKQEEERNAARPF